MKNIIFLIILTLNISCSNQPFEIFVFDYALEPAYRPEVIFKKGDSEKVVYGDINGYLGKFTEKELKKWDYCFVKRGCCYSDTLFFKNINKTHKTIQLKFQGGIDCTAKAEVEQNCNPIKRNKFYFNCMDTLSDYYTIAKGADILNTENKIQVVFYQVILKEEKYINKFNDTIKGLTLINKGQLLKSNWELDSFLYPVHGRLQKKTK